MVVWDHTDASGLSSRGYDPAERDALGNDVGLFRIPSPPTNRGSTGSPNQGVTFDDTTMGDCTLDGIITPCSWLGRMGEAIEMVIGQRRDTRTGHTTDVTVGADWGFRGNGSLRFWIPDLRDYEASGPTVLPANTTEFDMSESSGGVTGQWFTIGLGMSNSIPWVEDTPCVRMARLLGDLIDGTIREIGGTRGITSHQQLDDVMNRVDGAFTPFYSGWNGTIKTGTGDETGATIAPSSGGRERQAPFGGHPGGFKEKYVDNIDKTGQTHHFAAYFSAGINGVTGAVMALGHAALTDYNNRNDLNLSLAAYSFGHSLVKRQTPEMPQNPNRAPPFRDEPVSKRLARFRSLAAEVRSELCN